MPKLNLREGRDIGDIGEALNLLILFCQDNEEFRRFENTLLEIEDKVKTDVSQDS